MTTIAKTLADEDSKLKYIIKENLAKGETFAKAREKALISYLNNEDLNEILTSSNNILGIEYIKSIIRMNSNIKPFTLKREGSNYNDKFLSNSFSSATSIRELLKQKASIESLKDSIPKESYEVLNNLYNNSYPFVFDEDMFKFIKYKLQTNCINFNNLYEIIEGLENKLLKEISSSNSYEEFILNIKSKRYTYSKISRILTHIYIGLDSDSFLNIDDTNNLYARVLGFNKKGREILSLIKRNSSIPLITKIPRFSDNPLLKLDIQATAAYSILNNKLNPNSDYLISPFIKY